MDFPTQLHPVPRLKMSGTILYPQYVTASARNLDIFCHLFHAPNEYRLSILFFFSSSSSSSFSSSSSSQMALQSHANLLPVNSVFDLSFQFLILNLVTTVCTQFHHLFFDSPLSRLL